MKIQCSKDKLIDLLNAMVDDVDVLLAEDEVTEEKAMKWQDAAIRTLATMLGPYHTYTLDFSAIEFSTPFLEGVDELLLEETYRLGLEDSRSFVVALIDMLESEYHQAPGLMDMESVFAEMNRYVALNVHDPQRKDSIHHRITRLRDGILSGDITEFEVQNHIKHISYLDTGLFERLVPLITWYYIHRDL